MLNNIQYFNQKSCWQCFMLFYPNCELTIQQINLYKSIKIRIFDKFIRKSDYLLELFHFADYIKICRLNSTSLIIIDIDINELYFVGQQDKTFGLKNKKGAKTQKFIAQVEKQVKQGNQKPTRDQPEDKRAEKERKLKVQIAT